MNVLIFDLWGWTVLIFLPNWGSAMCLVCSYFFRDLSLNVLINMVLTHKKGCTLSPVFQQLSEWSIMIRWGLWHPSLLLCSTTRFSQYRPSSVSNSWAFFSGNVYYTFFYKNHVYKNVEAQISKKLRTC